MLAHPQRDAEKIAAVAWNGTFPVDPVKIALRLGIEVKEASLSSEISGALVKRFGEDPTILLNANDHPNRQRFTCAHELGHFIQREEAADEYEYVDLRHTILSASGTKEEEIYANQFAANLLMPQKEVSRLVSEKQTVTQMAMFFGVSQDAMSFRLKSLNHL